MTITVQDSSNRMAWKTHTRQAKHLVQIQSLKRFSDNGTSRLLPSEARSVNGRVRHIESPNIGRDSLRINMISDLTKVVISSPKGLGP